MFLKKLNQNFLLNKFLISYFYKFINFIKNFELLEISSGNGFLTKFFFFIFFKYKKLKLNILELDKKFCFFIKNFFKFNIKIFRKNFLSYNYYNFINDFFYKKKKLIIFGNLPYKFIFNFFYYLTNFFFINYENFFLIKKLSFLNFLNNFLFFLKSFFIFKKILKISNLSFFPKPNKKIKSILIKLKSLEILNINFFLKNFFKKFLNFLVLIKIYFIFEKINYNLSFIIKYFYIVFKKLFYEKKIFY